jgi:hypothetical protein
MLFAALSGDADPTPAVARAITKGEADKKSLLNMMHLDIFRPLLSTAFAWAEIQTSRSLTL